MDAICPRCESEETERVASETHDDGVVRTFRCASCDHEWDVPL